MLQVPKARSNLVSAFQRMREGQMATVHPEDALEVLLEKKQPVIQLPISILQVRFRLGYTSAVKLVEELEQRGFVRRISETAIHLMFDSEPNSYPEFGTKPKGDQTSAR